MPRQMFLAGLIEKNKLEQDSPWLFLFDLKLDGSNTFYFVNYPEEVIWNEHTYAPFYLRMDSLKEESNGSLPQVRVTASNVMREMEALLQQNSGLRGKDVTIHVVHKDDPSAGELIEQFLITEASSSAQIVEFTLEKSVPALEVTLPGRVFTNDEFPGIADNAKF
jgi:phage-related protein